MNKTRERRIRNICAGIWPAISEETSITWAPSTHHGHYHIPYPANVVTRNYGIPVETVVLDKYIIDDGEQLWVAYGEETDTLVVRDYRAI